MSPNILGRWISAGQRHCRDCAEHTYATTFYRRYLLEGALYNLGHVYTSAVDPVNLNISFWHNGERKEIYTLGAQYKGNNMDMLIEADRIARLNDYILTDDFYPERKKLNQMIPFSVDCYDN